MPPKTTKKKQVLKIVESDVEEVEQTDNSLIEEEPIYEDDGNDTEDTEIEEEEEEEEEGSITPTTDAQELIPNAPRKRKEVRKSLFKRTDADTIFGDQEEEEEEEEEEERKKKKTELEKKVPIKKVPQKREKKASSGPSAKKLKIEYEEEEDGDIVDNSTGKRALSRKNFYVGAGYSVTIGGEFFCYLVLFQLHFRSKFARKFYLSNITVILNLL